MKIQTKSLLDSLIELSPQRDTSLVLESRGSHVISSAITLIESIKNEFGEEFALDMEKRLLSSIRNRNHGKFVRGIRGITEQANSNIEVK